VLQNVPLLRATCWITVLIFVGFMTHTFTHMPVAVPAVIGIAAILAGAGLLYSGSTGRRRGTPAGVLAILEKDIEWPTLAFFIFLFILVGAPWRPGPDPTQALVLAWIIWAFPAGLGLSPTATLLVAALIIPLGLGFLSP
jgi:Na+/H+ antiporter NhaD/arsenite permease-like protein